MIAISDALWLVCLTAYIVFGVVSVLLVKTRYYVFPSPKSLYAVSVCVTSALILSISILLGSVASNELFFYANDNLTSFDRGIEYDFHKFFVSNLAVFFLVACFRELHEKQAVNASYALIFLLVYFVFKFAGFLVDLVVSSINFSMTDAFALFERLLSSLVQPALDLLFIVRSESPLRDLYGNLAYAFYQSGGNIFLVADDSWSIIYFVMIPAMLVYGVVTKSSRSKSTESLLPASRRRFGFLAFSLCLCLIVYWLIRQRSIDGLANDRLVFFFWLVSVLFWGASLFFHRRAR